MSPAMWHEIVVVGGEASHNIHEMEDSWLESGIEKYSILTTPAQLDSVVAWPDITVMEGEQCTDYDAEYCGGQLGERSC